MLNRFRLFTLAALMCTSVAMLAAPGASAAKLTRVTVNATDLGDGNHAGEAKCRDSQRAISGGYSGDVGASSGLNFGGPRSWAALISQSADAKIFAYCSKSLKPTRVSKRATVTSLRSERRGVGDPGKATATVECPKGTKVLSGGWSFTRPVANSPIYSSHAKGMRKWRVSGFSDEATDIQLIAFANCAKNVSVKHRSATAQIAGGARSHGRGAARGGPVATAVAKCKAGEQALGGGFSTSPKPDFANQNGPDTFFGLLSLTGSEKWKIGAVNFGTPGTITSIAYCLK